MPRLLPPVWALLQAGGETKTAFSTMKLELSRTVPQGPPPLLPVCVHAALSPTSSLSTPKAQDAPVALAEALLPAVTVVAFTTVIEDFGTFRTPLTCPPPTEPPDVHQMTCPAPWSVAADHPAVADVTVGLLTVRTASDTHRAPPVAGVNPCPAIVASITPFRLLTEEEPPDTTLCTCKRRVEIDTCMLPDVYAVRSTQRCEKPLVE